MSGSIDDVGLTMSHSNSAADNQMLKKSFGTPVGSRRKAGDTPEMMGTPRSSRSFLLDSELRASGRSQDGDPRKKDRNSEPVLDEWEAKLLGKKGAGKDLSLCRFNIYRHLFSISLKVIELLSLRSAVQKSRNRVE